MKHLPLHLIQERGIDVYGFTGEKKYYFCMVSSKQSNINMQRASDTGVS